VFCSSPVSAGNTAFLLRYPRSSRKSVSLSTKSESIYWVLLAPLFGILSGLLWIGSYEKFRNWRFLRPTALRTERLRRLLQIQNAPQRLPHRMVEEVLRRAFQSPRRIKKILRVMEPGAGILVLLPRAKGPDAPPRPIPFEAVEIDNYDERVAWLMWRHWEEGSDEPPSGDSENYEDNEESSIKERLVEASRYYFGLAITIALVVWVLWRRELFYIAVFGALIVLPILWRLIVNRTWFIVPGGVVLREDHIWGRQKRLRMATPDDSPLIADHRTGEALVMLDGRARKIVCPATLPLLVAAWRSSARRPTLEEVETLLGT
jgi:hypothetical protein